MSSETTIRLGTDVAAYLLYHPSDLNHTEGWPIDWYTEPFVYTRESEAGRLIGWCTGSDGTHAIRLTTIGMTARERDYARAEWTFPLKVRHECVLLDNSDALPGERAIGDPDILADQWFGLPNGDYAVTVTAIEWDAEPGAMDRTDDLLPNYVVSFRCVDDTSQIAPARQPPLIDAWRPPARDDPPAARNPFPAAEVADGRTYLAFVTDRPLVHGLTLSLQSDINFENAVEPGVAHEFAVFDLPLIAAAEIAPGRPALRMRISQATGAAGKRTSYGLESEGLVEILSVEGPVTRPSSKKTGWLSRPGPAEVVEGLHRVLVRPLPIANESSTVPLAELKEALSAFIDRDGETRVHFGRQLEYQRLKLNSFVSHAGLSGWAMRELPMVRKHALAFAAMSERVRVAWLLSRIRDGV